MQRIEALVKSPEIRRKEVMTRDKIRLRPFFDIIGPALECS
jgi:hypothetical protein